MSKLSVIWLDILLVIVGVTLLKGGIMGVFYSSGRGSNRPLFATVRSIPARVAIAVVGLGVLAWAIRDYMHRI
jgi:hypothetical protein